MRRIPFNSFLSHAAPRLRVLPGLVHLPQPAGAQTCPFGGLRAQSLSKGCALDRGTTHTGRSKSAPLRNRGLLLLAFLFPWAAFAQSVRWDPPGGQLGFNQVSDISLIFDNCEPEGAPAIPPVDGLVFGRPSQSSQTSIINFSVSRTYSLVFPARPTKRTDLTIPSFEIKTDKGMIRVAAANYKVGDATVGNSGVTVDDIASAKLSAPKDSFWAGEIIPVTYNLNVVRRYFHSLATNLDWQSTPLVAEDWTKPDPSETLIRGERRVVSTQDTRAYAKQPGTYTVKPATQMVNLMVGTTGFGLFSQPTVEQRQLETNPLQLTIKPLPQAPQGFSGAVGEFSFTSKVIPTAAAVGEPITWTLELSGTGNWPDVAGLPQREVSNDFQIVQPKSKRTMKDGSLFEGTLSEDVVLVPSRPGTYQLTPVHFTYFDTKTGTYRTVASDPVTLTVTAGAPPVQPSAGSSAPVQFSLNVPGGSNVPAAPVLPSAVPPVAPENLPRDPLASTGRGFVPFRPDGFWFVVAAPAILLVLLAWLVLAGLLSRRTDPQRLRREAKARLAAALAALRSASAQPSALNPQLRVWQQDAAALWQIPHAAPGAPLVQLAVTSQDKDAAENWARLWSEADRALHSREQTLPKDWLPRAESALEAVNVPGWPLLSLFKAGNLLPFLFALALLFGPTIAMADAGGDAYKGGNFSTAATAWQQTVTTTPSDWTARHNLGLALAQQDRWPEATAYWTGAFLLNARSDTTRWDLALGLQRSGMAPPELVELSRGEGRSQLARQATPGEWQLALILAALLLAAALIVLLLQGYRRIGGWAKPAALTTSLLAVLLAAAATLSLHTYGPLANPEAALVWKASVLRSIPTEADTAQKTSPLSAGSIAVVDKTFLNWTKLSFAGGQSGWVRSEDLIRLYR